MPFRPTYSIYPGDRLEVEVVQPDGAPVHGHLAMQWDDDWSSGGLRLGVATAHGLTKDRNQPSSLKPGQLTLLPSSERDRPSYVQLTGGVLQGSHRAPGAARPRRSASSGRLSAPSRRLLLANAQDVGDAGASWRMTIPTAKWVAALAKARNFVIAQG